MFTRYENHAKGIRILPGHWRPHYPFENIAWISPPWPSQDYVWLDFPEAIFANGELLYLSHVNPDYPVVFKDLPPIPWRLLPQGAEFWRALPNGVSFGLQLSVSSTETEVDIKLTLVNDSKAPLKNIRIQTCIFLRACREFSGRGNKGSFIHTSDGRWTSLPSTINLDNEQFTYMRPSSGLEIDGVTSDLPVTTTLSTEADRLIAVTWFEHTSRLWGNSYHPCIHADPECNDLAPGEKRVIHGKIFFHEGTLSEFEQKLAGYRNFV